MVDGLNFERRGFETAISTKNQLLRGLSSLALWGVRMTGGGIG